MFGVTDGVLIAAVDLHYWSATTSAIFNSLPNRVGSITSPPCYRCPRVAAAGIQAHCRSEGRPSLDGGVIYKKLEKKFKHESVCPAAGDPKAISGPSKQTRGGNKAQTKRH
jgi:hypothetical protein